MEKAYDIVVFGDTCVDLILHDEDIAPQFGQVEKTVAGYSLEMGGSCCIFAAQAAKLGLKARLLGKVGDDAFGQMIIDALDDAGVDTEAVFVEPGLKTGATVHLVQADDRAMLTYPGSLAALTLDDIADEILASARHLHYGSLFLQTGLLPHWVEILKRAKRLGCTVSLDTNWDPHGVWDGGFISALDYVDALLPNEQEALHLSGQVDLAAAAAFLQARVAILVVKQGAAGASIWHQGESRRESVVSAPSGGDGIGAGDSFDAGFLAGWLNGLPLETCLEIACRCGRAVAGRAGGLRGQLWKSQVPELEAY